MAILWITYWSGSDRQDGNSPGNAISSQALTITGTSAQSAATPADAYLVSLYADTACNFLYTANPTASATTSHHIGANERVWINAKPTQLIAGITT